jgi:hypothetical protein
VKDLPFASAELWLVVIPARATRWESDFEMVLVTRGTL